MALKLLAPSRGGALGGVVMAAALLVAGHRAAQNPDSAIPDEVAVIAAACRENSGRIKTLQLSGTLTFTGKMLQGQWDPIADQTYDSQTRAFYVWKDALNFRTDATADREVDCLATGFKRKFWKRFCLGVEPPVPGPVRPASRPTGTMTAGRRRSLSRTLRTASGSGPAP